MDQSYTHLHIAAYGKNIHYHRKQKLRMQKYLRELITKNQNSQDIQRNRYTIKFNNTISVLH